eukprot:scaffold1421_cov255-Pinguiococcus_pyrenoidosus.AAC.8
MLKLINKGRMQKADHFQYPSPSLMWMLPASVHTYQMADGHGRENQEKDAENHDGAQHQS